jgi:hypothetical protein
VVAWQYEVGPARPGKGMWGQAYEGASVPAPARARLGLGRGVSPRWASKVWGIDWAAAAAALAALLALRRRGDGGKQGGGAGRRVAAQTRADHHHTSVRGLCRGRQQRSAPRAARCLLKALARWICWATHGWRAFGGVAGFQEKRHPRQRARSRVPGGSRGGNRITWAASCGSQRQGLAGRRERGGRSRSDRGGVVTVLSGRNSRLSACRELVQVR